MLTAAQVKIISEDLDATLKAFAAKHNLVSGRGNGKYTATDFRCEVRFSTKESNPDEVDPRYLRDLRRGGYISGLNETMLGKIVTLTKGQMKFVGMRASKAVFQSVATKQFYLYDAKIAAALLSK